MQAFALEFVLAAVICALCLRSSRKAVSFYNGYINEMWETKSCDFVSHINGMYANGASLPLLRIDIYFIQPLRAC